MRYRALDAAGDYSFGQGQLDFLTDSPAAVAQAVRTRLLLFQGEWFLDRTAGTPWLQSVVGTGTAGIRDQVIRAQILGTPGLKAILSYSSSVDVSTRVFTVRATVSTIYSSAPVSVVVPLNPFILGTSLIGGGQGL